MKTCFRCGCEKWVSLRGFRFPVVLALGMAGWTCAASEIFVVPPGTAGVTPAEPYASWASAATNIQTAVTYAKDNSISTVTVSNGVYGITSEILVAGPITLRSFAGGLSGASNTVVRRSGSGDTRIFNITHADAVLQGLSITEGWNTEGAGVYMTGGLVRDCIIANNDSHGMIGGGVYMSGGTISNCIVRSNHSTQPSIKDGHGGGIYATGTGKILNCQILSNSAASNQIEPEGGGIYADSANVLIRNCLISGNAAVKLGGGVRLVNGHIQNCTIVRNWTTGASQPTETAGGGVYRTGGTVSNSIVYFNSLHATSTTGYTNIYAAAGSIAYTCTTNPVFSGNGNISDDPLFVNRTNDNYRLLRSSPCIDVGANQAWMTGAKDLDGQTRILSSQQGKCTSTHPIVDMGAYELYVPPRGTVLLIR